MQNTTLNLRVRSYDAQIRILRAAGRVFHRADLLQEMKSFVKDTEEYRRQSIGSASYRAKGGNIRALCCQTVGLRTILGREQL